MKALMDAVGAANAPVFSPNENGFKLNGQQYAFEDAALIFKGGWLMMQAVYGHRADTDAADRNRIQSALDRLRSLGEGAMADNGQLGLNNLLDAIYQYRHD